MFRMIYWFAAFCLLFFLPGVSLIMFFLWMCKTFLSMLLGFGGPKSQPQAQAQAKAQDGHDDVANTAVSPLQGRQDAAEFEEQARQLDAARHEEELLAQNASHHAEAVSAMNEAVESDRSWQDRLEGGYRP
jgi:hypothetical protein